MGRIRLPLQDFIIDTYYNHSRKEILIAHFKHGTSFLTDHIGDSKDWIFHKTNTEMMGLEDMPENETQFMHPKYDDYKKFITYRGVDESLASAFCYEMRTGLTSFLVDTDQTEEEYELKLRQFVEMAGGAQSMVNRWLSKTIHSNGTFLSIFYAFVLPLAADNIIKHVDAHIPVPKLADFLASRIEGFEIRKISNKTPKIIRSVTDKVFKDLGVFEKVRRIAGQQYTYKQRILEKPLYDTI